MLMLMLITLLNDGSLISTGYDNVNPKKTPEKWNLGMIFSVGAVLGLVALVSSLWLLWMLLDSHSPNSTFRGLGIEPVNYGQLTTAMYLKVSISDFLTVFSSRTQREWFWSSKPANILLICATFAMSMSTLLACVWPTACFDQSCTEGLGKEVPKLLALWIWLYCIVWWWIQVGIVHVFIYAYISLHTFKVC